MREASRHIRVMLEGAGSDEMLAGYALILRPYFKDRFMRLIRGRDWRGLVRLEHEARQLAQVNVAGGPVYATLSQSLKSRLPVYPWKHGMAGDFRAHFGPLDPLRSRYGAGAALGPFDDQVSNALWLDFCFAGLPETLHGTDAASMAFSIEARAPFLDHRLVDFCFALPTSHKLRDGWTKSVLRHALKDLLPPDVLLRRQKLGFPAPYSNWLAMPQNLVPITDLLLSRRCLERGILNPVWLRRLLGKPNRARGYARRYVDSLWRMACLELWFRQSIDTPACSRPP
jgi:asparagine synthase (glutamine-hydrolysing)